ncbi:hypothetical protein PGTUg99_033991 [Puccinia graminis f. sp. tritici]|uniref:Uncharacterized protein n=1 Tax=Puccinia graminis f. sp. tritici TaxID=56615 RepID=A0A5B0MIQ0_PUCGR|nr:hypothetical protein PGTUg99_033991 [Puccinia graminis f. sp. tritici]
MLSASAASIPHAPKLTGQSFGQGALSPPHHRRRIQWPELSSGLVLKYWEPETLPATEDGLLTYNKSLPPSYPPPSPTPTTAQTTTPRLH